MWTHVASGRTVQAIGYSLVVWLVGFLWSMVVYASPALWKIPSLPGISKLPAVSGVLLPVYVVLVFVLTQWYLHDTGDPEAKGRRLGVYFLVTNVALDLMVYFGLFGATDYFAYASIWVSYALLLGIPWTTGARMARDGFTPLLRCDSNAVDVSRGSRPRPQS